MWLALEGQFLQYTLSPVGTCTAAPARPQPLGEVAQSGRQCREVRNPRLQPGPLVLLPRAQCSKPSPQELAPYPSPICEYPGGGSKEIEEARGITAPCHLIACFKKKKWQFVQAGLLGEVVWVSDLIIRGFSHLHRPLLTAAAACPLADTSLSLSIIFTLPSLSGGLPGESGQHPAGTPVMSCPGVAQLRGARRGD